VRTEAAVAMGSLRKALAAGSERLAAWSDLLDRINVFPVADGDTGRNLVISLHPLKDTRRSRAELAEGLLMSARGNSGNIAAQFFQGLLLERENGDLAPAVKRGRNLAWGAVADPRPGTMLSLFDALADGWPAGAGALSWTPCSTAWRARSARPAASSPRSRAPGWSTPAPWGCSSS